MGHWDWDTLFLVNRLRPTFRFVFQCLHLGRQGGGTERVKGEEMLRYSGIEKTFAAIIARVRN